MKLLAFALLSLSVGCAGNVTGSSSSPCDDPTITATELPAEHCAFAYDADPEHRGELTTWSGLECPGPDAEPTPALWYDAEPTARTLFARRNATVATSADCEALYWMQSTGDY
jgi:hypothetical protein